MEQLIYISTARTAPTWQEIQDILQVSRRNNARDDVTGLLIVGGRRFLQVLEGPGSAVDAAFGRIAHDARHFAVVQLGRKTIDQRSFPDWNMGYQEGRRAADGAGLTEIVARLTEDVGDPYLAAELQGFASLHNRAA